MRMTANEFKTISEIAKELSVSRQAIYLKLKNKDLSEAVKPFTEKQGNVTKYSYQGIQLIKDSFVNSSVKCDLTESVKGLTDDLTESQETCQKLSSDLNVCQTELDKALKEIQALKQINAELTEQTNGVKDLTEKCKALESSCQVLETKLSEKENYINSLESDKASQSEQLSALNTQLANVITAANEERDKERQERQTILTRLWSEEDKTKRLETELSKYKSMVDSQQVTETEQAAPEPERQPASSEPQEQPVPKRSFFKRLFGKK